MQGSAGAFMGCGPQACLVFRAGFGQQRGGEEGAGIHARLKIGVHLSKSYRLPQSADTHERMPTKLFEVKIPLENLYIRLIHEIR